MMAFLDFHAQEIKHFLPDFTYLPTEGSLVFFILRDMVPAGLFIAEARGGGALWVNLDFVVPRYRDFKVGRFLYEQKADFLKNKGIRKIYSASGDAAHTRYLQQMGFTPDSSDTTGVLYSRTLN
jgi:GNAT superfamily N-acetyltransferase